jgi:hypothetical protein
MMIQIVKKIVAAAVLVAWAQAGFCGEFDGFRGIKWGDPPSMLGRSSVMATQGLKEFRTRIGEKLAIGQAQIKDVYYVFYKSQFEGVLVHFSGYTNYSAVLEATTAKYGQPSQPNEFMKRYFWGIGNPDGRVSLDYSEVTNQGTLLVQSRRIYDQDQADSKADADKAAGTDF